MSNPTEIRPAREIALETLSILENYTDQLAVMGRACENANDFHRLVDGIEVFVEAVQQVREAIHAGAIEVADSQEHRLAELLQKIFDSVGEDGSPRDTKLLTRELPDHLHAWKLSALPAIRDAF